MIYVNIYSFVLLIFPDKLEVLNGNKISNTVLNLPVRRKRIIAQKFLRNTIAQLKSNRLFIKDYDMDENTPRNSNEEIDTSEIKSRIGVNKVILN